MPRKRKRGCGRRQAGTAASPAVRRSEPRPTSISTSTSMPACRCRRRASPRPGAAMPSALPPRPGGRPLASAASAGQPLRGAAGHGNHFVGDGDVARRQQPGLRPLDTFAHACAGLLQQQGQLGACVASWHGAASALVLARKVGHALDVAVPASRFTTRAGCPIRFTRWPTVVCKASGVVSSRTTIWSRCWVSPIDKSADRQASTAGGWMAAFASCQVRGAWMSWRVARRYSTSSTPPCATITTCSPTVPCASAVAVRSMRSHSQGDGDSPPSGVWCGALAQRKASSGSSASISANVRTLKVPEAAFAQSRLGRQRGAPWLRPRPARWRARVAVRWGRWRQSARPPRSARPGAARHRPVSLSGMSRWPWMRGVLPFQAVSPWRMATMRVACIRSGGVAEDGTPLGQEVPVGMRTGGALGRFGKCRRGPRRDSARIDGRVAHPHIFVHGRGFVHRRPGARRRDITMLTARRCRGVGSPKRHTPCNAPASPIPAPPMPRVRARKRRVGP